jgi:type IV secretory pathway protease TraF
MTIATRCRRLIKPVDYVVAGIIGMLLMSTHWVMLNIAPSVPLGLYRLVQTDAPLRRGDLVKVPAVAFGRPWYVAWIPLLKPVAAVAGETVCVETEGVTVEGQSYGAVYVTHKGKTLPVFWGCHVVGEGEVFVASHAPGSLDGRYFGMTPVHTTRRAVPVLVWRE